MRLILLLSLLAVTGCLSGRLLGPVLKICPYRLGAILAAAFPTVVGLGAIAVFGEDQGVGYALAGISCGAGAAIGVFLTGHRGKLLACSGALAGGLLGAAAMAPMLS